MRHNFFKSLLSSCAFFLVFASQNSFAEDYVSTTDIVKEIEKSLIFDKDSREQIDFYQQQKSATKSDFSIIRDGSEFDDSNSKSKSVEILVTNPKTDNIDLREKEHMAYNAALIGQYEVAIQLYKQVLQSESDNSYVKFSLATVYQKIGQFRQAKALYYQLIKSGYDNQDEVIGNLLAIMVEESPRDAIYLLSRLSIQNPRSPSILAHAAISYNKVKNYDQAILLFKKAIALDPDNLDYQYNLAVIYDKTGSYEEALEFYSNVAKNYSSDNQSIPIDQVQKRIQSIRNKL